MHSPKHAILSLLCLGIAVCALAVLLCLNGCMLDKTRRLDYSLNIVPGPSTQIIAVMACDNSLGLFAREGIFPDCPWQLALSGRIAIAAMTDTSGFYPDHVYVLPLDHTGTWTTETGFQRVPELHSCRVEDIRAFIAQHYDARYERHVFFYSGHAGHADPDTGVRAMGPDVSDGTRWLDAYEMADALRDWKWDGVVADGCYSLCPALTDAMGAITPNLVATNDLISTHTLTVSRLARVCVETNLPMHETFARAFGGWPQVEILHRD